MELILSWMVHYGYVVLFGLLFAGVFAFPIPDETLLTFCGYLIYSNRLQIAPTLLSGIGGSFCGITLSYLLGARFGHSVLRAIRVPEKRIELVEDRFRRFGAVLLLLGYFIPGLRHFTAIVAGTSRLSWPRFVLFAYTGAVIWVTSFVVLGYFVGDRWKHTSQVVHRYTLLVAAPAVLVFLFVYLARQFALRAQSTIRKTKTRE